MRWLCISNISISHESINTYRSAMALVFLVWSHTQSWSGISDVTMGIQLDPCQTTGCYSQEILPAGLTIMSYFNGRVQEFNKTRLYSYLSPDRPQDFQISCNSLSSLIKPILKHCIHKKFSMQKYILIKSSKYRQIFLRII